MSPVPLRQRLSRLNPWQRLALCVWLVVAVGSVGRAALHSSRWHQGCYWVFADAGQAWWNGQDLYSSRRGLDVFRYSPVVGVGLVPVSLLPDALGSACLRLINVIVFLGGVLCWSRYALPLRISNAQRGLLWLLIVPLAASALLDVQTNALTMGLILLTLVAASREWWRWAGLFLAAACVIKVYPVVLALLLILVYPRRFMPRFLTALAVLLALPFLFGSPAYVMRQYEGWLRWGLYERRFENLTVAFRDVRLLFQVWLVPLSDGVYLGLRLAAAAVIAGTCLLQRLAGAPRHRLLATLFGLGCCWMTLFGPATEHQTYIFLAPVLAWAVVETWAEEQRPLDRVMRVLSFALFTILAVAVWFPHGTHLHQLGLHAVAGLLLAVSLAQVELRRNFRLDEELVVDTPKSGVYTSPLRRGRAAPPASLSESVGS